MCERMVGRMLFASCLRPGGVAMGDGRFGERGGQNAGIFQVRCRNGGGGGWKQKQEAEGTALWKCDEQKNVYVITLVGPKMD